MGTELARGDRLDERYLILEEIGRGGFGVVYRAIQEKLDREVAVKVLHPFEDAISGVMADNFRLEAVHTSRLSHPNIITLFDFGKSEDGKLFLVTELLEGEPLSHWIKRVKTPSSSFALRTGLQISKALAEAHSYGIVHGDLKPDNVFLSRTHGDAPVVKVLDFSIARLIGDLGPSRKGSLKYMSPEQFQGLPIQAPADVYAAGLVIYETLMGLEPVSRAMKRLSEGGEAKGALPLPAHLEDSGLGGVIRRATQWAPEHRFKDGASLLRALDSLELEPLESSVLGEIETATSTSIPALPRQRQTRPNRFGAHATRERSKGLSSFSSSTPKSSGRREDLELPGRAGLRAHLESFCDEVFKHSRGKIVLLEGDFGMGKSRFLRWLASEASKNHGARYSPGDVSGGIETLSTSLLASIGVRGHGDEAPELGKVFRALELQLGRALSNDERVGALAIFGWLGSVNTAKELLPAGELLMSLGHRQPLMLSFGALDRARPDTLDLLEVLAVQMAERPTRLLVVLTLAQDDALGMPGVEGALERLTTHSSFSRVVFEPLDDADAKSLARHSLEQGLGQVGVEKVAEFIAARAYGNPLYIKRLARFLVQSDLLEQVGTQVELSASVAPSHLLPPIISEFISQRLESLVGAFESRQHIQMMLLRWAMLGQSCSESLLRQVLRQEAREGHSCAAHILVRLDNLVERLLQLKVIEVESELERDGQVRRRFLFRNPLVMQFLLKRADYMPTAPGVHRLMGEVKRRYYGAAGQLESHREDVDRHERRSRLPAPNRAPAGWESHSEHWRWEGS